VKAWFNEGQNGHPAYYKPKIAPGIVADRHGVLYRLADRASKMPRVGSIITVRGGHYADSGVGISNVALKQQRFVVMRLDGNKGRILIPTSPMTNE